MNKKLIYSLPITLFCLGAVSASAEWAGERFLAYTGSWPDNYKIQVSILITGTSTEEVTIQEKPPAGWTIDAKSSKGVVTDGVITWVGTSFNKALTYTLILPENATGNVLFSGQVGVNTITGKTSIALGQIEPGVQIPLKTGLYYNYLLYLPGNYDGSTPFPLILHLHTWSERGTSLESVRNFGLSKVLHNPVTMRELFPNTDFPLILVSPQCPSNNDTWKDSELLALLEEIFKNYAVDRNRVYMTGNSFGGSTTWSLACANSDLFAAIVPISGGNPTKTQLQKLVGKVSVWSFHNKSDSVTSPSGQINAIKTLQDLGGDAQITLYEGSAHDAWTQTYSNPEFYSWLLLHGKQTGQTDIEEWMLHSS